MDIFEFKTDIYKLLDIINSFYNDEDIFIRELICNASDAIKKRNINNPLIQIDLDDINNTITITDNGIGMDKNDLINKLSNIGYTDTQNYDLNLIGKFGVGIFSSFLVAKKIEIITKKSNKCYKWICELGNEYKIIEIDNNMEIGTKIIIYLNEDKLKYLNNIEFEDIIERDLLFIEEPIYLRYEDKNKLLNNDIKLIWNDSNVDYNDYVNFYKRTSNDWCEPIDYIHYKDDNFKMLIFIPELVRYNMFQDDKKFNDIKIYVNGIFMKDNEYNLLPEYLKFINGVIIIDDKFINISRNNFIDNNIIDNIRDILYEQIIKMIYNLKNNKTKYEHFYELYSQNIKMGILDGYKLFDLLIYKNNINDEFITLDDYINNMEDGQKCIFYLTSNNKIFIERLNIEGYQVLFMNESIDEYILLELDNYKGYYMLDVAKEIFPVFDLETQDYFNDLCVLFYNELKDKVDKVVVSQRLYKSPCCIVCKNNGYTANIEKIIKSEYLNDDIKEEKKILELNPFSSIIQELNKDKNIENKKKYIEILYITGLIDSGYDINKKDINEIYNFLL